MAGSRPDPMDLAHRARLRVLHAPNGLALGQLDVKDHQYALWVGLNPPKVGWGRSRAPPGCMSAASRGRCRGSSRGCCGRLCGTRRAGHGPRAPLGPVGCGGGRGAPPCASHRPISTLERPSPAPWAAPEACLGTPQHRPSGPWWVYSEGAPELRWQEAAQIPWFKPTGRDCGYCTRPTGWS